MDSTLIDHLENIMRNPDRYTDGYEFSDTVITVEISGDYTYYHLLSGRILKTKYPRQYVLDEVCIVRACLDYLVGEEYLLDIK